MTIEQHPSANDFRASVWWQKQSEKLARFKNQSVFHIGADGVDTMVKRTISLQCNIQDGDLYLVDEVANHVVYIKDFE